MAERIVVGVALANQPQATADRLRAFCHALAAAAGTEIAGRAVANYDTLLDDVADGAVDIAWLPPMLAFRATSRGMAQPLAAPIRNGASSYSTALFTRADGAIRTFADLNRVRAAWVDRQSASGYLLVRAHLRALGLDLGTAFGAEMFLGHHDAVARAVLDGEADVSATFVYVVPDARGGEIVRHAGWGQAPVHVLTKIGPIPSDVLTCSSRVPFHVRTTLQAALVESHAPELELSADELFDAEGFAPCAEDHFAPLAEMFDLVGEVSTPFSMHPPPPHRGR